MLFSWLWRRLVARPRRDGRQVFRFWDGTRKRQADPLLVWSALDRLAGGDWQAAFRAAAAVAPPGAVGQVLEHFHRTRADATLKLGELVGRAFGVPEFDGGGLTVAERVALAVAFLDYMADLGVRSRPL